MEYLYCPNDNFEDYSSGRVIYGGKGIPNFPVRLLNEIYGRAKRNLGLLTYSGLMKRKQEILHFYEMYGKQSHLEALMSCEIICDRIEREIPVEVFKADCTKTLPNIKPDIIITDVPYGNLVNWTEKMGLSAMLEKLWEISHANTILAVGMDKSQKVESNRWVRIEKHNIGKRRLEILKKL